MVEGVGIEQGGALFPPRPVPDFRPAGAVLAVPDDNAIRRCQLFLASIRSVYVGQGCLTADGAAYMGIPFRFPTMEEAAPADVRPLRGKALAETTARLRHRRLSDQVGE